MRWHSKQDKWGQARAQHAETLAKNLTAAAMGKNVVHALKEINDRQLKQNDELRYMLNAKLKTRDLEGKISVRADVTIPDIAKAVAAFSELYRLDRLALGASTDNVMPATTADRLSAMTDDEIEAELERVRKRPLLN